MQQEEGRRPQNLLYRNGTDPGRYGVYLRTITINVRIVFDTNGHACEFRGKISDLIKQ